MKATFRVTDVSTGFSVVLVRQHVTLLQETEDGLLVHVAGVLVRVDQWMADRLRDFLEGNDP